jgi:hypothetical protein
VHSRAATDIDGEPPHAGKDEFESFIKDKAMSESSGVLIAPFTGEHGFPDTQHQHDH